MKMLSGGTVPEIKHHLVRQSSDSVEWCTHLAWTCIFISLWYGMDIAAKGARYVKEKTMQNYFQPAGPRHDQSFFQIN